MCVTFPNIVAWLLTVSIQNGIRAFKPSNSVGGGLQYKETLGQLVKRFLLFFNNAFKSAISVQPVLAGATPLEHCRRDKMSPTPRLIGLPFPLPMDSFSSHIQSITW